MSEYIKGLIASTYSIVAYDPDTGDYGVGVASKFLAIGHVTPWAEADVGAVATQSYINVRYGPEGLTLLKMGLKPREVVKKLISIDPKRDVRQVGIVGNGEAYAYTGSKCLGWAGHIIGDNYSVQGNLLISGEVIEAMAKGYETSKGELIDKIISSLEAGDRAGGDRRGRQAAAVLVVRRCGGFGGCEEGVDKYVDIRVDDHPDPIGELKRIFRIWEVTFLDREDPKDILKWTDVWADVKNALEKIGYLDEDVTKPDDPRLIEAFKRWMRYNNLGHKIRSDRYIWGSVYRLLIDKAYGRL